MREKRSREKQRRRESLTKWGKIGLPPDARTEDVQKLFDGYGKIVDCRVMTGMIATSFLCVWTFFKFIFLSFFACNQDSVSLSLRVRG